MESIMDVVAGAFRGNVLDRLSSQLEESPAAVERGVAQAIPLSVAGFAEQAQSEQSAGDLLARIREGNYPQLDPGDLGRVISEPAAIQRTVQSSSGFLSGFFGNKLNGMLEMVTGSSGLSRSSAGTLIGLIAPLVLGWIGKNVKSQGLNAHGLSRLLADEGQKVSGRLPAGFGSLFAAGGAGVAAARQPVGTGGAQYASREPSYPARATSSVSQHPGAGVQRGGTPPEKKNRALPWLLAGLAALAAILLWRGLRRDEEARAPEAEAPAVAVAPREAERPSAPAPSPYTPEPTSPQAMRPEGERQEMVGPEGAPSERAAPEGARPEGARVEGAVAERAGTEGAGTEGAGTEGAGTEGAGMEGAAERAMGEGAPSEGEGVEAIERQPVAGSDWTALRDDAGPLQTFFDEQGTTPQRFLLEGLEFGTGVAGISSNAMVEEAARIIAAHPNARVRIEGHTDSQGTQQANQVISQQRADAVKDYLVRQGVSENQLTAVGMASSRPMADNDTPEGRAQNRRVELVITQR